LEAALALWRYVEDSARFLFHASLGDPDADAILEALRKAPDTGLTRSEVNDLFGRNRPTARIDDALRLLEKQGLATLTREQTGGRPREVWKVR
jgi:predicted transcriptional regulator